MPYRIAADVVLVVHASYIAFVILGLVLIVLGKLRRWQWVHRPAFRLAHLAAIGLVVIQALLGLVCPLTTLESWLRRHAAQQAYPEQGFIAYWLHELIFFNADPVVFTIAYLLFAAAVLATLWWVPIRQKRRRPAP
ncbi:MAG: DUF2784 domain-containing protein [Phycisphaeraceae bacterium]